MTKSTVEEKQASSGGSNTSGSEADSSTSARELQQFLGEMRGRSPQEVMGLVAQSSLAQSIVLATVVVGLILYVGTAVPYYWIKQEDGKKSASAGQSKEPAADDTSPTDDSEPATDVAADTTTSPPTAVPADASRDAIVAEKLGVTETKDASPDKNPLDTPDIENLLDGVK